MFNTIVRASLANRLFVLIGGIAIMFYGLATLRTLPVDVFPDLNRPTVTLLAEIRWPCARGGRAIGHLPD